jgi:methylphosphotriester-DNA--protein-cysteine methyltransferase
MVKIFMSALVQNFWPSARHYTEAIQFPAFCFSVSELKTAQPALDRLGMPLVTSGQFAYVYKLRTNNSAAFAVRCFRGFSADRQQRYKAIDSHLEQHHVHALTSFDYEPEGILVAGKRYPILIMEWIDGPTLDLYLDEVFDKPKVVRHIADQWFGLISNLRKAGIAHGDLQHANIIVEHGRLRLVDLDGMFVPSMRGWQACEVGHQHYQHPRRDEKFFNEELDNFSALVIYLSLISIAEKPQLWKKDHDENLLFTRGDFREPEKSKLFEEIKELGSEHRGLVEEIKEALRYGPFATPSLLEMVEWKPQVELPLWMTEPVGIEVEVRTREDKPITLERPRYEISNWTPWQGEGRFDSSVPIQSNTAQTIFGTNPSKPINLASQARIALKYVVPIISVILLIYLAFMFVGASFPPGLFLGIFLFIIRVFAGAIRDYETQQQSILGLQNNNSLTATNTQKTTLLAPQVTSSSVKSNPSSNSTAPVIIGNAMFGVYHKADCEWVNKIPPGRRFKFVSVEEAEERNYNPCHVCFGANEVAASKAYTQTQIETANNQLPIQGQRSSVQATPQQTQTSTIMFVGNRMLSIYHKPDCEWAKKIPNNKRINFYSDAEVKRANYRYCHICSAMS